ncbi:MAG: hypothetical protein J6X55_05160 [Victivallales bacterium]|nr:hypothetical protein [Victivallales bacterium]
MVNQLQKDLRKYYASISYSKLAEEGRLPFNPLKDQMEHYAAEHPDLSPMMLKAAQYEIIADNFQPVLFRNDPFFFEMGLKVAEYDGRRDLSSGGWLLMRNFHLMQDMDPQEWRHYSNGNKLGLHLEYGIFDYDHHGFPYANVLQKGLEGICQTLQEASNATSDRDKLEFYKAAERGLLAVRKIASRFADAAVEAAKHEKDAHSRRVYEKLAEAASRVPWKPAGSFYEGLAVIWFLHEIGSVMDGVGMSIVGSPDQLLYHLYRQDLETKRLTKEEAEELLKIWLIHTDCKLDFEATTDRQYNGGEQGDTLTLGQEVNELTMMLLRLHRELKLIYPKIHCRINGNSTDEYLAEAAQNLLEGRNVLDFINDDVIIPAQVAAGKSLEDARKYVAGGCWEIMLEDSEHSQGANCYFDLARALVLSIQSTHEEEEALGLTFKRLDDSADFEQFYQIVMDNVKVCLAQMMTLIRRFGALWPQINPAPFFSACMDGCLESGKDYSAGGAKYSPHGLPLTDVATFIDSLLAVKSLCFSNGTHTLSELLHALRANWKGYEALRQEALAIQHIGSGNKEGNALLKRVLTELADYIAGFRNERGGVFQCGLYSYKEIYLWADRIGATPDGRRRGDYLTQGLTPSRLHADSITDVFRDLSDLPLERFPANSLLTCSLQSNGMDLARLVSFIRTWASMKVSGMIQLNCLSKEELDDAMIHPEKHQELIVRLYGFSAKFVSLSPVQQKEFITRQILK